MPAMILLLPLLGKLLGVLAVLGTLYASYTYWRHSVWVEGRDAGFAAIEKENAEAKQAAQKARGTIDQCFDAGGTWNVETGSCDRD